MTATIPRRPNRNGAVVTGRMVVISPAAMDALLSMETEAERGEPVLTDGDGRYFPVPPEGWMS